MSVTYRDRHIGTRSTQRQQMSKCRECGMRMKETLKMKLGTGAESGKKRPQTSEAVLIKLFFPTHNLWIHKLRQNFNSAFWPLDGSWNLEKFKPNVFNITPNLPAPVVNVIKLFRGNLDFAQS